ncbi:polysaccharide biosynthesis/export family protein [Methylobacterium sp. V23]|uniref:polysaccharide biosynthesis/export family protein n=1 Tax=Methylobacterium sp. V23 TaxID=2044878 RepID=UPI000CDB675D|nr:polysaccharide biosynthesis/export family protein [Methylobacterium sp. V23]POR39849.1 sugar ABC transporter substrate-binding protein [Methylobacterium sp. V23]
MSSGKSKTMSVNENYSRRGLLSASLPILGFFTLPGCTFISSDGPSRSEILNNAATTVPSAENRAQFVNIELNNTVVTLANAFTQNITPIFPKIVSGNNAVQGRIGVGDTLNITIFEASAGGLFIPAEGSAIRGGNFVPLPPQQVEISGAITVPYAGSVQAVGRTPQQLSKEIAKRLAQRAVEPQVVVSIQERRYGTVNVLGDVNTPTKLTIDPGGLRVLEAIARAGGPRGAPYETLVILKRGNATTEALLSAVLQIPGQNSLLSPGDIIFLKKEPKYYIALGATPAPGSIGGINNRRFTFENESMNLMEAAAKAGGLDSNRADPRSVFLYRLEARNVLEQLNIDTSSYVGNEIPTIYSCDFGRSDAFFLAGSFAVRSRDIIYVAEAPAIGFQRFTNLLSGFSSNANAIAATRAY